MRDIFKLKRWLRNTKQIFFDTMSWLGIFWLVVEMFSYGTNGQTDILFKSIGIFGLVFLLLLLLSLYKNRPKMSFRYKLRGKDNFLEVRVGDAFKNDGALIVPVNDYFDMDLGGNVFKASSIQNQVIQKYYLGKVDHLNIDIQAKIELGTKYDIGKTIELEQGNKRFYLVVNSLRSENNRVSSSPDDFIQALNGLWEYIALESQQEFVFNITSHKHSAWS